MLVVGEGCVGDLAILLQREEGYWMLAMGLVVVMVGAAEYGNSPRPPSSTPLCTPLVPGRGV